MADILSNPSSPGGKEPSKHSPTLQVISTDKIEEPLENKEDEDGENLENLNDGGEASSSGGVLM
jgi:hypothetical protein